MTAWVVIPGDENMRERPFATPDRLDGLLVLLGRSCIFVRNGVGRRERVPHTIYKTNSL